jgi:MFS family permease
VKNYRWLLWFTPFHGLVLSAAYLAPFFLSHGLSQTEIFIVQAWFAVATVLWEVPSGYLADRWGRARCIKLSVPIAAIVFVLYGLSSSFWQFVVLEVILAIADGLISGADTALLIDSLKAEGREKAFKRLNLNMQTANNAAIALGVPLAMLLVNYFGIGATLIGDGVLIAIGGIFAFKLTEAPHIEEKAGLVNLNAGHELIKMLKKKQVLWLLLLGAVLSTTTYIAFWLSAPYYLGLGIPLLAFSGIYAARSLFKAWVSHNIDPEWPIESLLHSLRRLFRSTRLKAQREYPLAPAKQRHKVLTGYILIGVASYLAMATGQYWLVFLVLGHDIIQILSVPILTEQINLHFSSANRAMLNSVANLTRRIGYIAAGTLTGYMVDKTNVSVSFVVVGVVLGGMALIALRRLACLKYL